MYSFFKKNHHISVLTNFTAGQLGARLQSADQVFQDRISFEQGIKIDKLGSVCFLPAYLGCMTDQITANKMARQTGEE